MSDLVVVTGAAGFLGGHLTQALLKAGFRVRAFVRRPPKEPWLLRRDVEVHQGDLADPAAVERAVRHAAVVYHAGATMSGSWDDYEQGTVVGTRLVVEACLKQNVQRLVHVSSLSVYDFAGLPRRASVTETWRMDPRPESRGNYARAKIEAEHIVRDAVATRGLRAVVVRPGLLYGPRGPAILSDIGRLVKGRFLVLTGPGSFPLPLSYVTNVVDALMRAAAYTGPADVFQIVDDEILTRRHYVKSLTAVTGQRFVVVPIPGPCLLAAGLACEVLWPLVRRHSQVPLTRYRIQSLLTPRHFDTAKARSVLGWVPRVGVKEAFEKTWTAPVQLSAELT